MTSRTRPTVLALLAICLAIGEARAAWNPDGNRVSHGSNHVQQFAAVPNGAGGAFIAWAAFRPDYVSSDVFLQSLDAQGEVVAGWPADGLPIAVASNLTSVEPDGLGGAYITFNAGDGGSAGLYAQHVNAGGIVSPGWPAGGLRLSTPSFATLAADGAGGVFVGLAEFTGPHARRQRVIRLLADGSPAPSWPADGVDLGPVWTSAAPAIASDGAGGLYVTRFEPRDPFTTSVLFVHRLTPDGAPHSGWPVDGALVGVTAGATDLVLAPHPGGVYVSWSGGPNICLAATDMLCPGCYCPHDQIVSHLTADGGRSPGWPADGLRLGEFGDIAIAENGELIAATIRLTSSASFRPFSQAFVSRLDEFGGSLPGWGGGEDVSPEARYSSAVDAVSDGEGGAFATWVDFRSGEPVLYVTRFSGNGSIAGGWPLFGSLAAPQARYPYSPALVSSGAGAAIVVWIDHRTGSSQVFADAVVAGPAGPAAPLGVVPVGFAGFGLRRVWPNPSRSGFEVTVDLPEGSPATLEVLDVAGRLIHTERFDFAGPARGSVYLDRDRRFEPGLYWLRLRQGSRTATQRIIAIR